MNNHIISALVATILYAVVKFFRMRFVEKENKPLKDLISDSCIVFLVTFIGLFATEHLGSIDGVSQALGIQAGGAESSSAAKAFTGKPNF